MNYFIIFILIPYFNIKQIGPILAKLISEFEGKRYIFDEGIILVTQIEFYEIYEIPKYNTKYNCAIITNSSLSNINKQNNIELFPYEKINRHINDSDLILYFDSSPEKEINFYDNNGKYLFDNKYSYIKDFIDTIIISKIDNPKEFNINEELNNFILENKPKVKKL